MHLANSKNISLEILNFLDWVKDLYVFSFLPKTYADNYFYRALEVSSLRDVYSKTSMWNGTGYWICINLEFLTVENVTGKCRRNNCMIENK